ncbi:efflux RND transporter periplasmic adaptor subunit [Fulvivirga sp. M361]|uniref:efflux RND transporter periplasmic adaptor subunit n=1 Tax=Fulvivirga sp. M361 TaxID=2594266 RepID=UPI00117B55CF|nr:efflux RND transporter periplasmic adaptor subunit [Fulvivirga sp. M361]TRX49190.1 efflux RND transporter periplasmic adaptor subunit [Fulvivirga sp. M361]
MKKTLSAIILIAVFGTACEQKNEGSISELIASGDIKAIQSKKSEMSKQQKALEQDIALLDSVINANDGNKKFPLVTTFTAKTQMFEHFVELQGDVTTKQNVLIYPEMAGPLVKVYVNEGDRVSKGQLLGTIDDGGMSSQLQQFKTQLALEKTTYERQKRLWEQKIGSEIQYLQAKSRYESQESAVAQMESQLGKYSIRAPFNGIIDDVIKDQGTIVAPGGPGSEVFRIVNLSNMYIEVSVPESYIVNVTPGKNVKVHFPVLNETVESKVRQTGNFINPDNRSFTVEIPVPNKGGKIKPNLTAKVQINDYKNEQAILIPQSIVSENAEGEQYAFVASNVSSDNIAEANKTIITTGKTQGDYVEVLSGITSGQNVIQEGARSVKDGQQVKILM